MMQLLSVAVITTVMKGTQFEISFTPDTLSANTWDNHGTLGNAGDISDFKQGTVQEMTTNDGESINALCFPAYSGHTGGTNGNGDEFITYIDYDTSSALNPELSMEIWIYPLEFNNRDWLLGNWQNGNSVWNDRSIIVFDDRFDGITLDTSGTVPINSPMSHPELNKWTQIVATFSDSSGIAKVYKNGGNVAEDVYQVSNIAARGYPKIGINGLRDYANYNFVGCVGKIQITNQVLNDEQISDLYDEGLVSQPLPNIYCNDPGLSISDSSCAGDEELKANFIQCGGRLSCRDSIITANNIEIIGANGADGATLTAPIITSAGYYSASNSIFDSKHLNEMTIYMNGYVSGYNSEVHCRSGAKCIIGCSGSNNGCLTLNIFYYDNIDQIEIYPAECKLAENFGKYVSCTYCPTNIQFSS